MANQKEILKNDLVHIWLDQEKGLLGIDWSEECGNILDKAYRKEISKINNVVVEQDPARLLINLKKCDYFVDPDNYSWYQQTLYSLFDNTGIRKLAFVVPRNMFVHAQLEAHRSSVEAENIELQYFRDWDKAYMWLRS